MHFPPTAPQGEAHHPPHIRSAGLQHRRAGAPPAGDEPKTTPRDGGRARGGGAGEEEKGGEVLTVCLDIIADSLPRNALLAVCLEMHC